MFHGYILHSKKNSRHYAGHTRDLKNRLSEHNSSESKSTRSGVPRELIHTREFKTRAEAMQWEKGVKSRGIARYLHELRSKKTG